MAEIEEVKATVGGVLKDLFGDGLRIERLLVERDLDMDGDEIFRVDVIYDGKKGRPDPSTAVTVIRHMRPRLEEIGEEAFPMISYISGADWRRAHRPRRRRPRAAAESSVSAGRVRVQAG